MQYIILLVRIYHLELLNQIFRNIMLKQHGFFLQFIANNVKVGIIVQALYTSGDYRFFQTQHV